MTDLITELVDMCARAEAKAVGPDKQSPSTMLGKDGIKAEQVDSALRRNSLEDAYQLVQQLRFGNSGDGFELLMRVESYLLNELLKEMSVTRELAASA